MTASLERKRRGQGGFTLVELAIVLLIIGLILGGILRGQELITSAQLNSVQTDANQIRTATTTFQDKFIALPGDYANAETAIDDSEFDNSVLNGDGNGAIDVGNRIDGKNRETTQFWTHLAASGLLTSIDGNSINENGYNNNGGDAFSGSIGGVFSIKQGVSASFNTGDQELSTSNQHWLLLGEGNNKINDAPVLDGDKAAQLDRKIDDGQGDSGNVRGGGTGACVNGNNGRYAVESDDNCALALQL